LQMNTDPIIDVHLHLWAREMYGKKYVTNKSEDFFRRLSYPLNATCDLLTDALDTVEARTGRPYHAWVQTLDHGVHLGMETTLSELNDYTAESVSQDKKGRLLGFAGIDPRRGEDAIIELERAIKMKGLRGLKLYPPFGFYPNDPVVYPIYEKIVGLQRELKTTLPVLIHQGVAAYGSKYCRPVYLDDVATNFEPDLKIIGAHAGVPWIDEMLWVTAVHRNLYFDICCVADLMGLWPEYYAEVLGKAKRASIIDRVLFASDWPCLCFLFKPEDPGKKFSILHNWVEAFKDITTPHHLKELGYPDITDEDKERILSQNVKAIMPDSS
jgi:predicted TIM-barrel fold metal-dependent hydrolase